MIGASPARLCLIVAVFAAAGAVSRAASPTHPVTVLFVPGKARVRGVCPKTFQRVLCSETVRLAEGKLVDVSRWRPDGKGVGVTVSFVFDAQAVALQVVRHSAAGTAGNSDRVRLAWEPRSPVDAVSAARRAAHWLARVLSGRAGEAPRTKGPVAAGVLAFEKALKQETGQTDALIERRSALENAVKLAPDWALARLELGRTILDQGDAERAARALLGALVLRPGDPQILSELGRAYRRAGRAAETLSCYSRALAGAPGDPVVHNNFGVALLAAGQGDGAGRHFRRAIELEPRYHQAYVNLAAYHRSVGKEAEAEKNYRRAVELAPRAAGPRIAWAGQLTDAGDLRGAERELETAVTANPRHAPARFQYALVLARRQRYGPAIRELERVVKLAPDYREAWYNLGLCHHYAGRHDRAIQVFEQTIRRLPDYAWLYYGLGLAHEAKEEPALAEAALEMALEKDATLEPARWALKRVRGAHARPALAWPWGGWCGGPRGEEASASGLSTGLALAALLLTALLCRP